NPERLEECEYVCDVGGVYNSRLKLFDHHQASYHGKLSSAGMVLLFLQEQKLLSPRAYDYFNETVILGVDAHDNGQDPGSIGWCTYSTIIASFNCIVR